MKAKTLPLQARALAASTSVAAPKAEPVSSEVEPSIESNENPTPSPEVESSSGSGEQAAPSPTSFKENPLLLAPFPAKLTKAIEAQEKASNDYNAFVELIQADSSLLSIYSAQSTAILSLSESNRAWQDLTFQLMDAIKPASAHWS